MRYAENLQNRERKDLCRHLEACSVFSMAKCQEQFSAHGKGRVGDVGQIILTVEQELNFHNCFDNPAPDIIFHRFPYKA